MSEQCEQMNEQVNELKDKQVAQCFSLNSWFFWAVVSCKAAVAAIESTLFHAKLALDQ